MLACKLEVDSKKCSIGLGFNHFCLKSPCNPLIADYAKIFYIIDEGDIPPIQCKMCLRGPNSMSKIDGLNFIFIDFYVPALTSRLNSTETLLQVSENITPFAVGHIYTGVISKET
jgi:hypothetical protein